MTGKNVVIVGAGKLGALLHDCLVGDDRWHCTGFIDDGKAGQTLHGLPIKSMADLQPAQGQPAFIAIGFPDVRRLMVERGNSLGLEWQTYIDRRSLVGQEAQIGMGTLILSFAMVASSVTIGDFAYLSSYSHVGSGSTIGAFTSLMASASIGETVVGEDCVIGLKSACLDGISLGDRVTVAPFTFVRRSVPSDRLVAGTPARTFKRSMFERQKTLPGNHV